jgi:hypothetical protein
VSRQRMAWLSTGDRGRRVRTEDGEGGGLRRHDRRRGLEDGVFGQRMAGLEEAQSLVQAQRQQQGACGGAVAGAGLRIAAGA